MTAPVSLLNDLIETLKDGQQGFQEAAADIASADLKLLFQKYSEQRQSFAVELQALARALGEPEPEKKGSVAGAVHRGWINLKAALLSKRESSILAECERGEDAAVAEYAKVLEAQRLPHHALEKVRAQFVEVKSAHDRIRNLRDAAAVK